MLGFWLDGHGVAPFAKTVADSPRIKKRGLIVPAGKKSDTPECEARGMAI